MKTLRYLSVTMILFACTALATVNHPGTSLSYVLTYLGLFQSSLVQPPGPAYIDYFPPDEVIFKLNAPIVAAYLGFFGLVLLLTQPATTRTS